MCGVGLIPGILQYSAVIEAEKPAHQELIHMDGNIVVNLIHSVSRKYVGEARARARRCHGTVLFLVQKDREVNIPTVVCVYVDRSFVRNGRER